MEFWGVEVKPGQPLKVQPELGKLIHISQAALGEVKDLKSAKYVPLRLEIDNQKFIIGTLSAEDRPQVMFDLVFEKEFEISHDLKSASVYFIGYVADDPASDEEFSDFDEESEDEPVEAQENGKAADVNAAKDAAIAASAAVAAKTGPKIADVELDSDSDEELSDDSDDDDESDDDDDDESMSSEEEELPKVQESKKRPAEPAQKTPVPAKKAKAATPDKSGNKKGGHTSTPFPSKNDRKSPAGNKSNGKSPKFGGQNSRKNKSGKK